jgi:hypothetical protein
MTASATDRPVTVPDPAHVRRKALEYLREERVRVISAATPEGHLRPYDVTAYVNGRNARYLVRFEAGAWSCSCLKAECAHRASVRLITGWGGPASKGGGQ